MGDAPLGGIRVSRWLGAGLAAGLLIWVIEGAASAVYTSAMIDALEPHNLAVDTSRTGIVLSLVVSLLSGLVLLFFYAAARPRFGPGPRTAIVVAIALWCGSVLVALIGYRMLGLFPVPLLATWGATGLVEWILASLLGGWIYREA